MGEMAEDILEGRICGKCHLPFTQDHGFPAVCLDCWSESSEDDRKGWQRAVYVLDMGDDEDES